MTPLDPELERLGDALRASTTIDVAREQPGADGSGAGRGRHAGAAAPGRAWRLRPRVLAGSTLGLAGVGAVLVLTLSTGGATAPPAFAVTKSADGAVLVNLTAVSQVPAAEAQLAAMGIHEWFEPAIENGAAPQGGPINCTAAPASTTAAGQRLAGATPADATPATGGPPVKLLLSTAGTGTVPAGDTGAGPWHLVGCDLYAGTFPGPGNTGNTGAG